MIALTRPSNMTIMSYLIPLAPALAFQSNGEIVDSFASNVRG